MRQGVLFYGHVDISTPLRLEQLNSDVRPDKQPHPVGNRRLSVVSASKNVGCRKLNEAPTLVVDDVRSRAVADRHVDDRRFERIAIDGDENVAGEVKYTEEQGNGGCTTL